MTSLISMDDSAKDFAILQSTLGLSLPLEFTTIKSPVFISLDTEFTPKSITQLGISIFEPRVLASGELRNPISNEYPISSILYSTKVCKVQERRRKPSHFGEKRVLVPRDLRALLEDILTPLDEQGCPRNVILVGHAISNDIDMIKKVCGLDVSRDISTVKAILDTYVMSRYLLSFTEGLSLKRLLLALELEYIGLHNAAHDSRYALRALLYMSCKAAQQQFFDTQQISQDVRRRLTLLEEISKFHQRRERILWCYNSGKVKFEGNPDLLDQRHQDEDDDDDDSKEVDDCGLLGEIFG